MPWISRDRLDRLESIVRHHDENEAQVKQAQAAQFERDREVMQAFTTLWPKHAEALRDVADPFRFKRDFDVFRRGTLDSLYIDTLVLLASEERERRQRDEAEKVGVEKVTALRTGKTYRSPLMPDMEEPQ